MAVENWKTPLQEIADPLCMQKWAKQASDADIPLTLVSVASAEQFGASYLNLLDALAKTPKFEAASVANELFSRGESAIIDCQANKEVLAAAVAFCKTRNNKSGLAAVKKEAWGKCQRHIAGWLNAFSSDAMRLQTAIVLDRVLYNATGSMSVDEALEFLKFDSFGELPSDVGEIVRWYLVDVRVKYRKDLKLKVAQVSCPKCGDKHDEGKDCLNCRKAKIAVDIARKLLDAKRWNDAENKANEVLAIWKDDADAIEIRDKAKAAAKEEHQRKKVETERIRKEREAEQARRAEEQRKKQAEHDAAVSDTKELFVDAIRNGEWDKAKAAGLKLAGLGEGSVVDWNKKVDEAKGNHKKELEKERTNALKLFDDALRNEELVKARDTLDVAKKIHDTLNRQYGAPSTYSSITYAERRLADKELECRVKSLGPVNDLNVIASMDGDPEVKISWRQAVEGKADKWRIMRCEKGKPDRKPEEIGVVDVPSFADNKNKGLKIGVEYEYGIIPLAEIAMNAKRPNLQANDDALVWSETVICLVKLHSDALKESVGEGEAGIWGVATLRWSLPLGVDLRSGTAKLLLSRMDGAIHDKDVTNCVKFEDTNVSVAQSYKYSLTLFFRGLESGSASITVKIEQMRQPEPVRDLHATRNPNGRWLVTWTWPQGMEDALVGPIFGKSSGDVNLTGAMLDAVPSSRSIKHKLYKEDHGVEVFLAEGVDAIAVCTFKDRPGGGRIYSKVEKVSIVARQTNVSYGFLPKSGGLFRKSSPAEVVIWSDTATLPDLVLVEGRNGRPARKDVGTIAAEISARQSGVPLRIALQDSTKVDNLKLFLAYPEHDADQFRIALPVAVPRQFLR